jgi:hypothetical protein
MNIAPVLLSKGRSSLTPSVAFCISHNESEQRRQQAIGSVNASSAKWGCTLQIPQIKYRTAEVATVPVSNAGRCRCKIPQQTRTITVASNLPENTEQYHRKIINGNKSERTESSTNMPSPPPVAAGISIQNVNKIECTMAPAYHQNRPTRNKYNLQKTGHQNVKDRKSANRIITVVSNE